MMISPSPFSTFAAFCFLSLTFDFCSKCLFGEATTTHRLLAGYPQPLSWASKTDDYTLHLWNPPPRNYAFQPEPMYERLALRSMVTQPPPNHHSTPDQPPPNPHSTPAQPPSNPHSTLAQPLSKAAPAVAETPTHKVRRLAKRGKTKKQIMMEKGGGKSTEKPATTVIHPKPRSSKNNKNTVTKQMDTVTEKTPQKEEPPTQSNFTPKKEESLAPTNEPKKEEQPKAEIEVPAKKVEILAQNGAPPEKEEPLPPNNVPSQTEEPPAANIVPNTTEASPANKATPMRNFTKKAETTEEAKSLISFISQAIAQALVNEQEALAKEGVNEERLSRARLQLAAFQAVKSLNRPLEDLGKLAGDTDSVAKVVEKAVISSNVFRKSSSDTGALSSRTGQFSIHSLSPVTKDYISMVVSPMGK